MKLIARATIILFVLISFSIPLSYGINENGDILVIAGDKNYPPYEFLDDDGEYRGFNVDLMRAIAIEMGVEIKLLPMDWLEVHRALQDGEIDAVQGMNFNKQRKEFFDFSTPYLLNSSVFFVRTEDEKVLNSNDFKGKIVAVQRSDSAAYILAEIGEIEVMFVSDLEDAFDKLNNQKIDAVFGNRLTGIYILNKLQLKNNIKIMGEEINQVDYGIAVRKGNTVLLKDINEALERLKKNGTYSKIYEKWFGKEAYFIWEERKYYVYGIIGTIVLAIVIFGVSVKWNNDLKAEVNKRTEELYLINQELDISRNIIKESDKFKEQIIDSLSIGLITFDNSGGITAFNQRAEKIFELNRDDCVGRTFQELGLDKFFNIEHINYCIQEEKGLNIEETIFNLKGEKYYYNYLISPLYIGHSKNSGGVLTFRNITEEKTIRNALSQKDKMQSLGRMIAGLAHEIRNPLTSIKTYLEILPIKYDNPKFREKITVQVPQEITRLDNLLTDLLDYAKPKKNHYEEFSITPIIDQTISLLESSINKKNIEVIKKYTSEFVTYGDIQMLKQILINILLNSIEAIELEGKIGISVYEVKDSVYIDIEDDGLGIDNECIDKIFEPFYTTKENGTGLGLSICYQQIKGLGGDIIISSKKGIGTKVSLILNNGKG
ncbi:transporter substrate-binding domain-containing protein [Alkaliphilus serpentinus]|uniref:histidine kinase n=1 Tax=Alkaliphilus serpentinus TaxID=1482731 RepID=A0A833M7Y9_9FIRM|nr:transporter substrate-binding domain-containing protein [Alkaliphilus serpentinus]KAB3529697.1 transporter substrate-binding domain-containing protein [Alkaliphilus serpentinus]